MATSWAGCRETHVSAVYLVGEKVLKLKKPIRTDFLDFTSVALRTRACEEELRLNRRLSPDVYLGVTAIDLGGAEPEPAVLMRRLDDADQLGSRLREQRVDVPAVVDTVTQAIVGFHHQLAPERDPSSPASWTGVEASWRREWEELGRLDQRLSPSYREGAGRSLGMRYLAGRKELFAERLRAGWVREGHGDLRAEHIYLTSDGIRIIDCVEFDRSLRTLDTLADLAFLVMDLERIGQQDAASLLRSTYRTCSRDQFPESLADFFIAQRALIRAKVALLTPGSPEQDWRDLVFLAEDHLLAAQPRIVCIGGLPGSGKSTLAAALAADIGATHLSSDAIRHETGCEERTELSGWNSGRYTRDRVDETYDELLRRASVALGAGGSVILDASWRASRHRKLASDLAVDRSAVVTEIRCTVDEHIAEERVASPRGGYSQAGREELRRMQREFEAWPTATVVPTDSTLEDSLRAVKAAIERSVHGLVC